MSTCDEALNPRYAPTEDPTRCCCCCVVAKMHSYSLGLCSRLAIGPMLFPSRTRLWRALATPARRASRRAVDSPRTCKHGRRRSLCLPCAFAHMCPHGAQPSRCGRCNVVPGDPVTTCDHGIVRRHCVDCRATRRTPTRCPHGRHRGYCADCGGYYYCEHGKRPSCCHHCGGAGICCHDRQRSLCRECKGYSICPHGVQREYCLLCGGSSICPHNRRRTICLLCRGGSVCSHGVLRKQCSACTYCKHNRSKYDCRRCWKRVSRGRCISLVARRDG